MKARILRIHERYRDSEFGTGRYPEIRLAGNWLRQAGFRPGGKVKVNVERNKLTIIKEEG